MQPQLILSNVNNPLFHSNFPPNYSILINIFYQIITILTYIFMSMIMIWRHVHVLLISQYRLLRVNIHSKSLESLDHRAPWLPRKTTSTLQYVDYIQVSRSISGGPAQTISDRYLGQADVIPQARPGFIPATEINMKMHIIVWHICHAVLCYF